jgi:hypothetical protein
VCVMAVWWCCDAADSMTWVIEAAVVACAWCVAIAVSVLVVIVRVCRVVSVCGVCVSA